MKALFSSFLILLLSLSFQSQALNYYWHPTSGTNWSTLANWKTGSFSGTNATVLPTDTDNIFIGHSTTNYTVILNISDTIKNLTIQDSGQIFINTSNGSVLSVKGNITSSNTNITGGGSATIKIWGTGPQSLTGGSSSGIGKLPNVKVDKSGDTLKLYGYITMGGSTTLTCTAGTVSAGTSTVAFYFSNTIAGAWTFYDVEFQGTNGTFSISHNITVNDTLKITGSSGYLINNDTINLNGNLRAYNTSNGGGGSTVINIVGSGSQTIYSSNTVDGKSYLPYIRINKSGDTLHLHGTISVQQGWSNNYSASKIKCDYTSELCFYWANLTCPIGGLYSTPVYRLALGAGTTLSPSNCGFNITRDSAFIVEDTFKQVTNQNCGVNNHSLVLNGPIYSRVGAFAGSGGGSTTFLICGNKNQTLNCVEPSSVSISLPSIKVQKSGGKLFLYGNLGILGNWTNNFSKDSIISGTSRVYVWNNNATSTIGGTYPTRFNKFYVGAGNITYNFTIDSAVIVSDTFYLRNGGNYSMGNHSVVVYGDIIHEGGSNVATTPTVMFFKGSNNQRIKCTSSSGGWFPAITLAKTGGTVYLSGYLAIAGDWTNNYSTANINYGTARIYSGLNGRTMHWGGSYPTPVHELVLNDGGNTYNLTHDSAFIVKDTLWLVATSGSFTMTGNALVIEGNIVNGNTYVPTFGNTWIFGGSNNQTFAGANGMNLYDVKMNKTGGTLKMSKPIAINHSLAFTKGTIKDSATLVTFNNSATVSGASDSGFISGPVKKVGNQAYTFPTGKGLYYNPIAISAPSSTSDAFTGEFFNSTNSTTTKDTSLTYVSTCQYWQLDRTTGTSNVKVKLFWNSHTCDIYTLSTLRLAYLNSGTWKNAGAATALGNTTSGRDSSNSTLSSFGSFTIGKKSPAVFAHAGTDKTICSGSSTTIGASPAATGGVTSYTYSWSPSTGLSSSTAANPTASPTATTTYILTVTDLDHSTAKDTMILHVNALPVAHAGRDTSIYYRLSVLLGASPAATGGTSPYSYSWSPSTDLDSTSLAHPLASPGFPTNYILTVTDSNSCIGKDTIAVTVNPIPQDIIDRINEAPYIFEGQVVSSIPYWTSDHRTIYTSNIIEVSNILKGDDLECGTIELITQGGIIDSEAIVPAHALKLAYGNAGIFLCNPTNREPPSSTYYTLDNSQVLGPIFEGQSFVQYWWDGFELKASDLSHSYGTLSQIYALASMASSGSWVNCGLYAPAYRDSTTYQHTPHSTQAIPKNNPFAYQKFVSLCKQRIEGKKKVNLTRSVATIDYTISNPVITGTSPKYYEFDLNVGCPDPNYLTTALVRFEYSTAKFGDSIVQKNKVQITRGSVISDSTSYPAFGFGDISSNVVAIGTFSALHPTNLTEMIPTGEQLYHVKIEIADCNAAGDISFTHQDTMLELSTYGLSANDTTLTAFDAISATQTVTLHNCDLHIASFSPDTVNAGIGQILTIRGYNFGSTEGTGNLFFKNADDGGKSEIVLGHTDIPIWTDTLIRLFVPSYSDTTLPFLTPVSEMQDHPIGTGTFRLVTDNSLQATTTTPLVVFYAVLNKPDPTTKTPLLLAGPQQFGVGNYGYKFYVDSTIWHTPEILKCIKKALRDWNCLTGVNWEIDSMFHSRNDTTSDFFRDSVSFIHFGNPNASASSTLMLTSSHTKNCPAGSLFIDETDIVISPPASSWSYDTTGVLSVGKYDFYHAILHELGHAQSLGHVIDVDAMMYYSEDKMTSTTIRKIDLSKDRSCQVGGNYVMNQSTTTTPLACDTGALNAMVADYNCAPFHNGVEELPKENIFRVYPNPSDNTVTIDFWIDKNEKTEFNIVNIFGQKLFTVSTKEVHNGKNSIIIDLKNYPAGIYLLCGMINDKYCENKIVHFNTP